MKLRTTYFDRAVYKDQFFADELEPLAGNMFIELGQVNNFYNGLDFTVIGDDGEYVEIKASPELFTAFDFYYNVWDNFNQFKILPHGKGTMHENLWLLDLIKYLNGVNSQIEHFHSK